MKNYTVFSQQPDDAIEPAWLKWPPVDAGSPDAAIKAVRDSRPELKADKSALFFAVANFEPKRMRRRLVETWELGPASEPDDEPAQGQLA